LDVTEGFIEVVSGKLIIRTNFVGALHTLGGSIEFLAGNGVVHNFTDVQIRGGYFDISLPSYTLDSVVWVAGGFRGLSSEPAALTINNLSYDTGNGKLLTNVELTVPVITTNTQSLIFSGDSASRFIFVGTLTVPRVSTNMFIQYFSITKIINTRACYFY
jgi:hypothetical protein